MFGHSIIIYSSNWSLYESSIQVPVLDCAKQIINLIQMPVFFSLSGFLFLNTLKKNSSIKSILWMKVKRLLIPFLVFSFFWLLPIRLIINYPGYSGKSIIDIMWKEIILGYDNGHMWYLPTLLLCFILSILLYRYVFLSVCEKKRPIVMGGFSLIIYAIGILIVLPPYIKNVCLWYWWFVFGLLIKEFEHILEEISLVIKIILLVLTVVVTVMVIENNNIVFQFLGSICWGGTFYICIQNKKNHLLNKLSEYSFGMYLLHSPLVYITYTYMNDSFPLLIVVINFCVYGMICFVMTGLIKKSKVKCIIGE